MDVERQIEVRFATRCGEQTARAVSASLLAAVEGRLAAEQATGRVDGYDVRIGRPAETGLSGAVAS